MIESLTVENFRCFKRLRLKGLRRVNVLVGDSASGKTALLEAIYLNLGVSPELALRIRAWRSQDTVQLTADSKSYESLWSDLFHKFDLNNEILIAFDSSAAERRSLRIRHNRDKELLLPLGNGAAESVVTSQVQPVAPIEFLYSLGPKEYSIIPEVTPKGLSIKSAELPPIGGHFFTTQTPIHRTQYATLFSTLSTQKREGEIVEALQTEFGYIESLSVELSHGAPMLYASVGYLPEKIPVALLSSGINKLLCLLLAIASSRGGVLVVDEIETGFYYQRMASIWRALLSFAKRHRVQIFASTHSGECLAALAEAAGKRADDAALIRTHKENGTSQAEQFGGTSFFRGMRLGEVR